jgi:hypothetical protein
MLDSVFDVSHAGMAWSGKLFAGRSSLPDDHPPIDIEGLEKERCHGR